MKIILSEYSRKVIQTVINSTYNNFNFINGKSICWVIKNDNIQHLYSVL